MSKKVKRTKEQKIEDLKKLIPVLPPDKQREALLYLQQLGEVVFDKTDESEMVFAAKSVPGKGRELRIPMYLETFDAGYYQNNVITDTGAGQAATGNPTVIFSIPSTVNPVLDQTIAQYSIDSTFGHFSIKNLTFSTRQTPWSKMRVVGIETDLRYSPMSPTIPDPALVGDNTALGVGLAVKPRVLLKNYRVSGSANLFLQEGFIDGTFFSSRRKLFGGLRAYPILESPKVLKVDVAVSGEHYHGGTVGGNVLTFQNTVGVPTDTEFTVTVAAIVEVLDDVEYGKNISGPYARGESLIRTPPRNGQAFISGE